MLTGPVIITHPPHHAHSAGYVQTACILISIKGANEDPTLSMLSVLQAIVDTVHAFGMSLLFSKKEA